MAWRTSILRGKRPPQLDRIGAEQAPLVWPTDCYGTPVTQRFVIRLGEARAGIVKWLALQFVTIPDKASPFRDHGGDLSGAGKAITTRQRQETPAIWLDRSESHLAIQSTLG